jgi:hypothetical protein
MKKKRVHRETHTKPKIPKVGDVIMSGKFARGKKSDGVVEVGCYESEGKVDPTRAKAKFVVERAELEGGGTAHGPYDVYPDGWHITARRLFKNGKYNPKGEVIDFYMTGCFNYMIEKVKIVDKMQMCFK